MRLAAIAVAAVLLGAGPASAQFTPAFTKSQVFRDSALFFPDDSVADARATPALTDAARKALESDLNRRLAAVRKMAAAPVMAKLFGELTPIPRKTRIILTNFNAAEARTEEDGTIAIDVRVVQASLRSALVTQYRAEIDIDRVKHDRPFQGPFTAEEERLAINTYLAARAKARKPSHDSMDMFGLSLRSRTLSGLDIRYDSEMQFLVAHELGHLALGHFGPHPIVVDFEAIEDECAIRRAQEVAADIYAASLEALATPVGARDELFGSLFNAGTTVGDGFDTFFQYAYDYAGFTSGGRECRNYPPPAERLAMMQRIYKSIREGQTNAILQNARKP